MRTRSNSDKLFLVEGTTGNVGITPERMKVAILAGTVRKGRQSHRSAYYLEKTLKKRDVDTDLIDLALFPFPIFGVGEEVSLHKEHIASRLQNADALILVTPEYHGSFSGVLKNTLDHFGDSFRRKPVGVVAASTGRMGGINASTQLQQVILSMGAFPLPSRLLFPDVAHAFNDSFEPQLEQIVKRTNKFLDEFLWFADAIHQKRHARYEHKTG